MDTRYFNPNKASETHFSSYLVVYVSDYNYYDIFPSYSLELMSAANMPVKESRCLVKCISHTNPNAGQQKKGKAVTLFAESM